MAGIFEYENEIFKYDEKSIYSLIESIKSNEFVLPQFQREFVWSLDKAAALVDTILKGYPAGSLMLWRTKQELVKRNIATGKTNAVSGNAPANGYNYILDGQQRITTLNACIEGLKIGKNDFKKIYVNLNASDVDESIVILQKEVDVKTKLPVEDGGQDAKDFISVRDMCNMSSTAKKSYSRKIETKIESYQDALIRYPFPIIQLTEDVTIDVATDIFERVNVQGEPLGLFEIMVARTYDENFNDGEGFDLSKRYKDFADKLKIKGYEHRCRNCFACCCRSFERRIRQKNYFEA